MFNHLPRDSVFPIQIWFPGIYFHEIFISESSWKVSLPSGNCLHSLFPVLFLCPPVEFRGMKKRLKAPCEHILCVCVYAHMCSPVELEAAEEKVCN